MGERQDYQKRIAEKLKECREKHGTQLEVARAIGVGKGTLACWETGERMPGIINVCEFCEKLKVSPNWLTGIGEFTPLSAGAKMDISEQGRRAVDQRFDRFNGKEYGKKDYKWLADIIDETLMRPEFYTAVRLIYNAAKYGVMRSNVDLEQEGMTAQERAEKIFKGEIYPRDAEEYLTHAAIECFEKMTEELVRKFTIDLEFAATGQEG